METKKGLSIPFIICVILIGSGLYREFDAQTMTFKNPMLSLVYFLTLVLAAVFVVMGRRKKSGQG